MNLLQSNKKDMNNMKKDNLGNKFGITSKDVIEAGLCFGHKRSRCNPKMKPYISGMKGTIQIIDANEIVSKLTEALDYIQKIVSERKILLLVGTKVQFRDLIKQTALECDLPYVADRWVGGTFTNFKIIKQRVDYLKSLEEKEKKGELEKYTKKERIEFDKEIQRLREKFDGLKNLDRLPDAVFIASLYQDKLAAKEAKKMNIPTIAIVDTDADPTLVDWPILGNDDAISSLKYILGKIKQVIKGKK